MQCGIELMGLREVIFRPPNSVAESVQSYFGDSFSWPKTLVTCTP